MTHLRRTALSAAFACAFLAAGCSYLTTETDDDDENVAALNCLAAFEGSEYQSLVAQFEAQEAADQGNPPQLFYGEASQTCYLNESECKAGGNVLCRIVAESRMFGLPVRPQDAGSISPAAVGAATAGVAAAAAIGIGIALGVSGGNSSTTSTTNP